MLIGKLLGDFKIPIRKNSQNKNKNRKRNSYRIHEKVLVRDKKANKYEDTYKAPYHIADVWKNVTAIIGKVAVQERINIR